MGTATARANDLLAIFMNDQLALGIGYRELARRAHRENAGTPLGDALHGVAEGIAEDIRTFEGMMSALGVPRSPVKGTLAVAGERVSRLKLNGRVTSYSPLSRFIELDVLTIGLAGKPQLWMTLRDLAGLGDRLPEVDFDELIRRAKVQHDALEPFRLEAGREAFRV
ncbi:MAG TPA: hypothetical protein VLA82_13920 [Actinomycetota bacterium]|nr:hypothetical protein [Actinomycetota bacterium]